MESKDILSENYHNNLLLYEYNNPSFAEWEYDRINYIFNIYRLGVCGKKAQTNSDLLIKSYIEFVRNYETINKKFIKPDIKYQQLCSALVFNDHLNNRLIKMKVISTSDRQNLIINQSDKWNKFVRDEVTKFAALTSANNDIMPILCNWHQCSSVTNEF